MDDSKNKPPSKSQLTANEQAAEDMHVLASAAVETVIYNINPHYDKWLPDILAYALGLSCGLSEKILDIARIRELVQAGLDSVKEARQRLEEKKDQLLKKDDPNVN